MLMSLAVLGYAQAVRSTAMRPRIPHAAVAVLGLAAARRASLYFFAAYQRSATL